MNLPSMDRRTLLRAVFPAAAGATLPVVALTAPIPDPLLALIAEHRRMLDAYSAQARLGDDGLDELAEQTFERTLDRLADWQGPAPTYASAHAALTLALEEVWDFGGGDVAPVLMRAVLGYLEAHA